ILIKWWSSCETRNGCAAFLVSTLVKKLRNKSWRAIQRSAAPSKSLLFYFSIFADSPRAGCPDRTKNGGQFLESLSASHGRDRGNGTRRHGEQIFGRRVHGNFRC